MTDEPMMIIWPSDELARRLAAYGVALTPSPESSARARTRVMAQATTALSGGASATTRGSLHGLDAGATTFRRRAGLALAAAGIGMGALAGVAAAADPGGALYSARLWAEEMTLPTSADARLDADFLRLDRRLSEARAATSSGNGNGARAALDAYVEVVDDALATAGTDSARDARVAAAVEIHRTVLGALADRLPGPASDAVNRALARSDAALGKLDGKGSDSHPAIAGPADDRASAAPGAAGGGPSATGPVKAGSPSQTVKPQPTPKASRPASPAPRPSPTPTDAPAPTSSGADQQGNDTQGQSGTSGAQTRTTSRPGPTPTH